ncbi:MAG: alpha/beta hydrolase [Deltaproteobacteria bacterium RBG_19FT_COMBO_60_16]|nr:MAG: alpha/beta hydrolase [Deltaproteobacteria bacterium RBG_16_64_85]OGQ01234.1 MAG: alpha/beta hydrolase [Deltaproteobacteria bacterium RBG_19FT_COMBO_60_16]
MIPLVAGGNRLEFIWHGPGPGDAPTLVFLHDGIGCAATWRDFPAALARETGCGALVYSRVGYGGSDPVPLPRPLTYMQDEGFILLPEVLDATGVRKAFLVGQSDGGSIALLHSSTQRASPRVCGLLLEAPHVFCEEVTLRAIEHARDEYLLGDLRAKLERYHGGNVDCAFWGWNQAWLDPGFRAWNIEDCLPAITVPVLVVQGLDDPYGTLRQVDAIERQCGGPVRRCILERSGHSPHRDQRERTLSTMASFVRELSAGVCLPHE